MEQPLFSIITPVRNGAPFIRDAIESVRRQGRSDVEHIIIDGSSDDGTIEILREYDHLVVVSEKDNGQSDALNKGFKLARGKYIGWLNADDVYLRGAFQKVDAILSADEITGVYSNLIFVDRSLREIRRIYHHPSVEWLSLFYHHVPSATLFFKRELIEKDYRLDTGFHLAMDMEFCARLLKDGVKLQYVDDFFAAFRWHGKNKTAVSAESRALALNETFRIYRRHGSCIISNEYWARWLYCIAKKAVLPYRLFLRLTRPRMAHANVWFGELAPSVVRILDVPVHAVALEEATKRICTMVANGGRAYVCLAGAHGIVEAGHNAQLKTAFEEAALSVPDGMPLVWIGRMLGFKKIGRVFGPDLMLSVCRASVQYGYTHFLYGGENGVAEKLAETLRASIPGIKVVGTHTPPFRTLTECERAELQQKIQELQPDFFWVGLGTPKQELFMAKEVAHLNAHVMLGVGAAFDYLTDRLVDSPFWVKAYGLQWFHRLLQEPGRLSGRYIRVIPRFLVGAVFQLARHFLRPRDHRERNAR